MTTIRSIIKGVVLVLALMPLFVIFVILFAIEDVWNKLIGRDTE